MLRLIFTTLNSICFFIAASAVQARVCDIPVTPFVQVVEGRLDAGTTTFTGYRLTQDGKLSRASWTDSNEIIGLSAVVDLGAAAYQRAVSDLSQIDPPRTRGAQQPSLGGPSPYSVQIALQGRRDLTGFVRQTEPLAVVDALTAAWDGEGRLMTPERGSYIWSLPIPAEGGRATVRLAAGRCADGLAAMVGAAVTGPALAQKVPQEFEKIEDLQPVRAVYIARMPDGYAHFGIVSRK